MPPNRRYRQGWLLFPALAFSTVLQGGAMAAYTAMQPEPPVKLRIHLESMSEVGDDALILSDQDGLKLQVCTPADRGCRIAVTRGSHVRIDAMPGTRSTFLGWEGCKPGHDVLRCEVTLDGTIDITVKFGAQPEQVNVAMLDTAEIPGITLPPTPEPEKPKTLEEIEAEKLEEAAALEVAMVPPLPPDFIMPPLPPEPPAEQQPKQQPPPPPPEMRMVEVPDENEVKDAPDDATHLSDKNRDVAEETSARETNLDKEMTGESVASLPSEDTSEEIGGPDDLVRQTEDSESTTNERVETSDHSGESETAVGEITGEAGEDGEDGEGPEADQGMFAMRDIEGRGSVVDQGGDGKKKGKKGKSGVNTQLDFDDYERIVGKERADKEREIAKRTTSTKRGRYKKKLEAIKSALENFTPDVRVGNQTALKTRANPFAVYIARMHRRIHELWGFGFLVDMDKKSSDNPLNDFDLFTSIEISVNPDGTIFKTTIAKGSGELEFDVAALDTVLSGGPYETTPEAIRSVDGRVYLRWGFYRNWRQCGTFNVEPYILTDIPGGIEPLPDDMDTSGPQQGDATVTPEPPEGSGADGEEHDHDKDDAAGREAKFAANMWVAGFSTASIDRMIKVSAVPFYGGAEVAAQTIKDLQGVYEALIVESGALKDWELLTPDAYSAKVGAPVELTAGALVMLIHAKETFAVVLVPTRSGEYQATAIVRN